MSTSNNQSWNMLAVVLLILLIFAFVGRRHFFHDTGSDIRTTVHDAGQDLKSTGRDAASSIRDTVQ